MSGLFKPLLIVFGVVSSIVCAVAVSKLGLMKDSKRFFEDFRPFKFCRYMFWLTVEIGKADWAITKVILDPELKVSQRLIAVPSTQQSDTAKALFANSITITPGTVTVETEDDYFIVHALTDDAADLDALAAMNAEVCATEADNPAVGSA